MALLDDAQRARNHEVLFEDPRESNFKKYLISLNCTKDGEMPLAMSVTSVLGYWVRHGSDKMPGDAKDLFRAMGDRGSLRQIYISAQWPCHPIINLAMLEPRLVTESG